MSGQAWHNRAMAKVTYRIVPHHAGGYAVEVGSPKNIERVQPGFKSEAKAEAWVTDQALKSTDQWVRQAVPHKER